MKKVLSIILLLAMILTLCACGSAKKGTEGLVYEAGDGVYRVIGYEGEDVHIVIPDTHNGVPVTAIDDYCFEESEIQSVKIGKNVQTIGKGAFIYCTLLKEVTIPASVSHIGTGTEYMASVGAFAHCTQLEKVTFEKNSQLKFIGNDTFENCGVLTKIEIPQSLESMGYDAFAYCTSLKEIRIPASVESVGDGAFSGFTKEQTIITEGDTYNWDFWTKNCEAVIISK